MEAMRIDLCPQSPCEMLFHLLSHWILENLWKGPTMEPLSPEKQLRPEEVTAFFPKEPYCDLLINERTVALCNILMTFHQIVTRLTDCVGR